MNAPIILIRRGSEWSFVILFTDGRYVGRHSDDRDHIIEHATFAACPNPRF